MNTFEHKDFSKIDILEFGEYEHCTFIHCNFSEQDFSNYIFLNCEFKKCNLSMTKVIETTFGEVIFINSKLQGIAFNECNNFNTSLSFQECILNFSNFSTLNLQGINFMKSTLKEVSFVETNLTNGVFDECDLSKTIFIGSNLAKSNFETSYNYSLDPELNNIKSATFSLEGIKGLLLKYNIIIN